MAPTIRIDDDVYGWLQQQARPFEDTPNSVLRRIAHLDAIEGRAKEIRAAPASGKLRTEGKTPQTAYRAPILRILRQHGGQASRVEVLRDLETVLRNQLTPTDKADIASGTIRWQKSAEWEVRAMREAKLLKPVDEAPRGVWALTKKGEEVAQNLS